MIKKKSLEKIKSLEEKINKNVADGNNEKSLKLKQAINVINKNINKIDLQISDKENTIKILDEQIINLSKPNISELKKHMNFNNPNNDEQIDLLLNIIFTPSEI